MAFAMFFTPHTYATPQRNEYAVKSVFLYNFCKFMEWPRSTFSSANDPLVIGVFGDDPFGPLLNEAVAGESYHGHPITIEHYRDTREIKRCHLLFVTQAESGRLSEILAALGGKSTVTVGETTDFLENGGMISLTTERNRVRLQVNPAALRAANIDVSAKLLRIAEKKS